MPSLILYTRAGCCLCEGLEERLRELLPAHALRLVDVDGDPALQARYGLSVPVLALANGHGAGSHEAGSSEALSGESMRHAAAHGEGASPAGAGGGSPAGITPLPPVPPRLKGAQLRTWLRRHAGV
jgi:hypothetical protein